jgi:predicted DCC family thiol-disulfide oxidoreductase YuxK
MNEVKAVVFFDGVCNLCNGAVDFFIKRDKKMFLRYASLQSDFAKEKLADHLHEDLSTVVLLINDDIYVKSEAIIRALIILGGPYSMAKVLLLIPRFIRDFAYEFIAKNRYRFFGKKDSCRLPTPAEKNLFL